MKNQQGFTLVSLLVGLAISMLCLIALLALFRTVIHTSVDARKSSILDTKLQNSLTTIQVLTQNAGFGYPASLIPNIVEVASITNVTTNKAILWRLDDDIKTTTASICQGITYTENALILLKSRCSYDLPLATGSTWEKDSTLASFPTGTTITFELKDQICAPYGSAIITGTKVLNITASDSTGTTIKFPVCLSNILSTS
ncbi:PilW family protein [Acinetobacter radioresistens]|uniref:PilW family protein n=1 Tax=Acinetobacter radioresistens TaxID=40216 RepID=UPI00124FA29A|nr:prepilin-type N-terminal cleavage/methylation domain-containing protein [Acinetobacter radioresistens]